MGRDGKGEGRRDQSTIEYVSAVLGLREAKP